MRKKISSELSGLIANKMKNHSCYTQQFSQHVGFRTPDTSCTWKIVEEDFNSLIELLSLLLANIIDALTPKQFNYLLAVADGNSNFSSVETLSDYKSMTSADLKNLRNATLEKDLIDVLSRNVVEIQYPVYEYLLKYIYE